MQGERHFFGDEEIKEIIPAIKEAKAEGLNVSGPIPPDTVFFESAAGFLGYRGGNVS